MAEVDVRTGFSATPLADWLEDFNGAARRAFGDDVDLSPETLLGQLNGIWSQYGVQFDEKLLAVANGSSFQRAVGVQLDDQNSIHNIGRRQAERSEVVATLGGAAGTVVPAGTRASTTTGADFRSKAAATIGTAGTVNTTFEAVDTGPVEAAIGTLTRLIDVVTGLETITNAAAATLGKNVESDATYRARSAEEREANAQSSVESVRAAVLLVEGVTACAITENKTAADVTVKGSTIVARGLLAIVTGGENAAVVAAIESKLPAGTETGDGSVTVGDTEFQRSTDVPIQVTVDITRGATFPGDGLLLINDAIVDYVAGLPTGRHVDVFELAAAVYAAVPPPACRLDMTPTASHVTDFTPTRDPTTDAGVLLVERLTLDPANVTITV